MPEFQGSSDKEETFKFASLLLEAGWLDTHAFVNGTAALQVRTLYVAHGSKIKVTVKDKEAKTLETVEGFVYADTFRKKIALTPAHAPGIFFEVELPDHHLKAIGQKLLVKPAIRVYDPTWKDKATGAAVKDIKRGMDLQIEAKTENLPDGSDARITFREKHGDLHGAHDLIAIPVQVQGNKLSLLWRFEYPKETYEFSSKDERGRTEEKYAPPKIFFEASAHGATAKGPEADFLDFVVVEVTDSAGNPRADQKVKLTLPDGTKQEATSDAEGLVKVAATKPGRVEVELVAEPAGEAPADATSVDSSKMDAPADNELDKAIASFEAETQNFAAVAIHEASVRARYLAKCKDVSSEIREAVANGQLTVEEAAQKAYELRIVVKNEARSQSSIIGRAVAESSGPIHPLEYYLQKYTEKNFPGKDFIELALEEKQTIYREIIESSKRTRVSFDSVVPGLRIAGGALFLITISISAYNIWCAQNKIKAGLKEGIVFTGGAAGGLAADALGTAVLGAEAGMVCGPAAPLCASGLFVVGGIVGAIVASTASHHYDQKIEELASWLE